MRKCGMIKEAEYVDWEWHDGRMKTRVEYRLLRGEYKKMEMASTSVLKGLKIEYRK